MEKNKKQFRCCLDLNCKKYIARSMDEILISPFDEGMPEIQKLFSYFLYFAPDIESVHSRPISTTKHSELFSQMIQERHFTYRKFCAYNSHINSELSKCGLEGDALCLKCKRYVCKKKKIPKGQPQETDLDCFLRHIRNSIAHGRVFLYHGGNKVNIVFEDFNSTGNLSARIVCIKADLEHWKKVLSVPDNYNQCY